VYCLIREYGFDWVMKNLKTTWSYGDDGYEAFAAMCGMTMDKFMAMIKKHWGWTLTPGTKSDVYPDSYPLDQVEFLQRRYYSGQMLLTPEKLKTAGRYYKSDPHNARLAILAMLQEASKHGRKIYDEVLDYYNQRTTYTDLPSFDFQVRNQPIDEELEEEEEEEEPIVLAFAQGKELCDPAYIVELQVAFDLHDILYTGHGKLMENMIDELDTKYKVRGHHLRYFINADRMNFDYESQWLDFVSVAKQL
jgi:hypothetical protein